MADEPDLSFDIDALFEHLANDLDHDLDEELDWTFTLRSADLAKLQKVAAGLESEFDVELHDTIEEIDLEGNSALGDPVLSLVRRGVLSADEVKAAAEKLAQIANENGLQYEGVSCYDPMDEDELYGWLAPEYATWRLRHMTDCGLEVDADLPWVFLVLTPDLASTQKVGAELTASGFDNRDDYDEPDEDGEFGLCIFEDGRNNESELEEACTKIAQIAERHGGRLQGVQFYSREDMEDVFGGDESSES